MVLDLGKCDEHNDFEKVLAHCDEKSKGGKELCCRLGEQINYLQVKNNVGCVVDVSLNHIYNRQSCTCTKADYTCGYGFTRRNEGNALGDCVEEEEGTKLDLDYDICAPNEKGGLYWGGSRPKKNFFQKKMKKIFLNFSDLPPWPQHRILKIPQNPRRHLHQRQQLLQPNLHLRTKIQKMRNPRHPRRRRTRRGRQPQPIR